MYSEENMVYSIGSESLKIYIFAEILENTKRRHKGGMEKEKDSGMKKQGRTGPKMENIFLGFNNPLSRYCYYGHFILIDCRTES